jgi:hypothetical protein
MNVNFRLVSVLLFSMVQLVLYYNVMLNIDYKKIESRSFYILVLICTAVFIQYELPTSVLVHKLLLLNQCSCLIN